MSNYAACRLVLTGSEADLDALVAVLSNNNSKVPLNLGTTVPMPEKGMESVKSIEAWRDKNWGTDHIHFGDGFSWLSSEGRRTLYFYSRDFPPITWLGFTDLKYPTIDFSVYYIDFETPTYEMFYGDLTWNDLSLPFLKAIIDRFDNVDKSDSDVIIGILNSLDGDLRMLADLLINHYAAMGDNGYSELVKFIDSARENYRVVKRGDEIVLTKQAEYDRISRSSRSSSVLGKVRKLFKI
jgi:hypothetical protein